LVNAGNKEPKWQYINHNHW